MIDERRMDEKGGSEKRVLTFTEPKDLDDAYSRQTQIKQNLVRIMTHQQEYKNYGTIDGATIDEDRRRRLVTARFISQSELSYLKSWIRQKRARADREKISLEGPDFLIQGLLNAIDNFIERNSTVDTYYLYQQTIGARGYLDSGGSSRKREP